jgi:hypothetical protein
MAIALVVCLCLLLAGEARGARYTVLNCEAGAGWDADWTDTTGGALFAPAHTCAGTANDHLETYTLNGDAALGGGQFGRWRWLAAPGTYLTKVTGVWWRSLADGMEQVLGPLDAQGGFAPALTGAASDLTGRPFELDFPVPVAGFEDRLLCARDASASCSLRESSGSAIADVALEVEDDGAPQAALAGALTGPGWHRGVEALAVAGADAGSGVRYGETLIDGARAAISEYWCAASWFKGTLYAGKMRPCLPTGSAAEAIDTAKYADGSHSLVHCAHDFAGLVTCTAPLTIGIDNGAPDGPRVVTGGDGWRRVDRFDLGWTDPDQGGASPIVGAYWRLTGPGSYDSGAHYVAGAEIAALPGLTVPGPGEWHLHLWLRDAAGNAAESSATDVPLRFDDGAPSVAFEDGAPTGGRVEATVADPLSGPAAGTISYRRAEDAGAWTALATTLHGEVGGKATLSAPLPDLGAGTWAFRAEASDAAGNTAATTQRADGSQMTVTGPLAGGDGAAGKDGGGRDGAAGADGRSGSGRGGAQGAGGRERTRLFARLRGRHGGGTTVTVPFAAGARLTGRLTGAGGKGLAGRVVKVVVRPARGSLAPRSVAHLRTGRRGGFALRLAPGTSRRILVSFAGNASLAPAARRSLHLRVRSRLSLKARPASLRNGQTVHFAGWVRGRGASIPRRGKLVAIQYREADTGRWRPVLVTRTDGDGRFHARYRFRYIDGTARIRLRATALAEADWPFAAGSSKPVTVEVSGG